MRQMPPLKAIYKVDIREKVGGMTVCKAPKPLDPIEPPFVLLGSVVEHLSGPESGGSANGVTCIDK